MTSQELYFDIKLNGCQKAYPFLKKQFMYQIKKKYTPDCIFSAEDNFQNAFVKLYDRIANDKLSNQLNLRGYFATICKNDFTSHMIRNKVSYVSHLAETELELLDEVNSSLETEELLTITAEMIGKLPRLLQKICVLLFVEGKDHKEVALELNLKYDHVRKYQYKAVQLLRQKTPSNYQDYLYAA